MCGNRNIKRFLSINVKNNILHTKDSLNNYYVTLIIFDEKVTFLVGMLIQSLVWASVPGYKMERRFFDYGQNQFGGFAAWVCSASMGQGLGLGQPTG